MDVGKRLANKNTEEGYDPTLYIPKEIFFCWIFPCFDLKELCSLREVSVKWKHWTEQFLYQLKYLDVTPVEHILTSDGLRCILEYLHHLAEINLNRCWISGTESNLLKLGTQCQDLRSFSAEHCKEVTDKALFHLAKICKMLTVLEISFCFSMTDDGLTSVAQSCKNLQVLKVANNYSVSDKSVSEVAKNCKCLEELDVSRCFQVTDEGVKGFIHDEITKPHLLYMRVTGCNKITFQMMQKFAMLGVVVNTCF